MKTMKNIFWISALTVVAMGAMGAMSGCEAWTESEQTQVLQYGNTEPARSDEYYKNLRAWKDTWRDRSISFGWFDWGGAPGLAPGTSFTGLPDSMDMVSLWSGPAGPTTPEMKADMKRVQELKGTKVLMCTFIQHVGQSCTPADIYSDPVRRNEYWGWVNGDEAAIKGALEKYAIALRDKVVDGGFDGLDIDFEPNIDAHDGTLDEDGTYVGWFLERLSKYLGPLSGSGKMLCIDGEITASQLDKVSITYVDYMISQAYSVSSGIPPSNATGRESGLDTRLTNMINRYSNQGFSAEELTRKLILTENMESATDALNGGFYWVFKDSSMNTSTGGNNGSGGNAPKDKYPSLMGFAMWKPNNGFLEGGFGGYRFSNEQKNNPPYKWLRRAIQAQNPAQPK